MKKLSEKLKNLPNKPGVYLFKNSSGEIIYIGKAKNLNNRVKSYFQNSTNHQPKTLIMIPQIIDLDYIVVSSEKESLILENNLIKEHKPRFNVQLRDDKNYQFIKLDYDSEIPQIYPVRKIEKLGKNKYFGPYTSGLAVKRTLKLITHVFQLCRNKKIGSRPCFNFQLKRCPGVCFGTVSINEYKKTFKQIEQFLKYRQTELIKTLSNEMKMAAQKRQYERAANIRDKLTALTNIWEKQKMVSAKLEDQDYVGLFKTEKKAVVYLFLVRQGKLLRHEQFNLVHHRDPEKTIIERFLINYYPENSSQPKEIFLPVKPEHETGIKKLIGKIKLTIPRRGKKAQLLKLASDNAKRYYQRDLASFEREQATTVSALIELQNLLNLPKPPARIEGYDISNLQGTNPVGSMVVFENATPAKNQYRKFKINVKETPDDFAMMEEMLRRRLKKRSKDNWKKPDLIIIDGGKGQLGVAVKLLKKLKLNIPVLGLAKREEEIFTPTNKKGLKLGLTSPTLQLLQRIRDEAHRFAVNFHTLRRSRSQIKSQLDQIPGIGPITKKKLLKHFGAIQAIKNSSLEELAKKIGADKAKRLKEYL